MSKIKEKETDKLIRAGKKAGEKAREENFSLNKPIHIIENGFLVSVDKAGTKTVIKKLDEQFVNT